MLKLSTKFRPEPANFEKAYRAGFRYAEFWLNGELLQNWEEIASISVRFPMQYALHFPNCNKLSEAEVRAAQELYLALNASALVIHEPMRRQYDEILRTFDPHIRLAVENHYLTTSEWDEWASGNRWLTLDVEHLWQLTLGDEIPLDAVLASVEEFMESHGGKLAHVHLPGYWSGCETHRPMFASRELVYPVLSILDDYGFRGLIVSEADARFQSPLELRMDVLCFERWRELQAVSVATTESSGCEVGDVGSLIAVT